MEGFKNSGISPAAVSELTILIPAEFPSQPGKGHCSTWGWGWNWNKEKWKPLCAPPALSRAKPPQILPFLTLFPHLSGEIWTSYSFRIHLKNDGFGFLFFFFPQLLRWEFVEVCGSLQFYLLLISSPVVHTKFQPHLSTSSSHSGALPRSVSDPKVHSQPKKKKNLLNTNIQLFITEERQQLGKKKKNVLTGEETKCFQFSDFPKSAKKTQNKKRNLQVLEVYIWCHLIDFNSENVFKHLCCFYLYFHPTSHRSWRLRSQEDSKISILFLESKGRSSKVVLRVKRKEKWGCPGLARKYPSDTWQFSWEHSGTLSTSYLRVWIFLSQNIKDCHPQDNSSGLIVTKFWFFSPCRWFPSISPSPASLAML